MTFCQIDFLLGPEDFHREITLDPITSPTACRILFSKIQISFIVYFSSRYKKQLTLAKYFWAPQTPCRVNVGSVNQSNILRNFHYMHLEQFLVIVNQVLNTGNNSRKALIGSNRPTFWPHRLIWQGYKILKVIKEVKESLLMSPCHLLVFISQLNSSFA